MTERYDFPNDKLTKMLRFFSVVEAYSLIYTRNSSEISSFAVAVFVPRQSESKDVPSISQ